jgi:hypothetical protein
MTNTLLETIDEYLDNPEKISPETMEKLAQHLIRFFETMTQKLLSSDQDAREKALVEAMEFKESLEARAATLLQIPEPDPAALEEYMKSPLFSTEHWNALVQAKKELESYALAATTANDPSSQNAKVRKPKKIKNKI